jgi:hypothetical protein
MQLELFTPEAPAQAPPDGLVKGLRVDRSGAARYVHLIRSPEDPERTERPRGGRPDRAPHRTLELTTVDHWKREILRLLSDGVPRTFNRLGVELLDQTADMLLDSPVDRALWELVEASLLEHTMEGPIYFRNAATS